MKVTVCFGNVRVVVPCGDGDILVKDLIREATLRYKKATGKGVDSWVSVHNLQSQGGGILDPDDRLSDVVDDREQILASFDDREGAHHHHGGGDGASGSSVGTGSPDIFHDGEHKYGPSYPRTDIEVTGEQIASGVPGASLQVRRGSEPALNQLPVGPPAPSEHTKRWSAAPIILEPPTLTNYTPTWTEDSREEDEELGFRRITRDGSNRLSMQFLGDGAGYRWEEAAERILHTRGHSSTSLPRENKRKEPLGQANNSTSPVSTLEKDNKSELIVIRNEPGPLGIHVVPDYDRFGKDKGLLVQGIEPGGRIDRDGRLAIQDRIIEINGQNLINMPFQRVQEMFKLSLTSPELRLRVIKSNSFDCIIRKPPPPIYPRFPEDKENVSMVECEQKQSMNTKVATVSPTKKLPTVSRNLKTLLTANTRKIGRKIEIELTKGPHGLGFSITTRDNPAGGNCPIYIKNIIPKGAAVEDGRLKIGDRLLEVNGVEMTGKTQAEAVSVLRNAPTGSKVSIVVSRQEDVPDTTLPRIMGVDESIEKEEENLTEEVKDEDIVPPIPPLPQSHLQRTHTTDKNSAVAKIISQFQEASNVSSNPHDKTDDSSTFPWKHKEILTFNIPVHDSEKAGLGISVKGKTSGSQDLGIFIKSVINGGAASRDKRLRTNDQLLNVNGVSLQNQSNGDAMETLRKAMLHTEGPVPGNITLTIARRASSPGGNRSFDLNRSGTSITIMPNSNSNNNNLSVNELYNSNETESSITDHSGGSTNTVIFNPHKQQDNNSKPLSPINTWNPVIDRLMGHNKQLRNESYYKATNDTWNSSSMYIGNNQSLGSTTINLPSGEPVLIEDEYGSRMINHQNSKIKLNPNNSLTNINMTNGGLIENRKDHEPDGKACLSGSNYDKSTDSQTTTTTQTTNDVTYASQLSLENPAGFSRDAFGRQSMSEKRHATLDAKNTDTYQRSKKLREERMKKENGKSNLVRVGSVESVISVNRSSEHPEYADKLGQLGPSLGMKKSSSLESLQTMVQEIQMQEEGDPAYSYRGPGGLKVIRGKGCEESFRAAVDKDYNKHVVDPNHRSEISAKKHWLLDPPTEEREIDGFTNVRGGPRQSSLNAAIDNKHKHGKKKPGILKGIGSMFRFGKHRKMDFNNADVQHYQQKCEFDVDNTNHHQQQQQQQQLHHQHHQQQQQHHHPQQQQQQLKPTENGELSDRDNNNPSERTQELQREPLYQRHGFVHHHAEQVQVIPEGSAIQPVRYRSNNTHIDQNRDRNLQRHHRQTFYPIDERDNHYDQRVDPGNTYGEYGRPGSRSGITDSVPFTHYVNYNELQSHISRKEQLSDSQIVQMRLQVQQQRLKVEEESRKHHQYHSQRQTRQENHLRPVSNFYEYESVQSMLNSRIRSGVTHNNNNNSQQQQQHHQQHQHHQQQQQQQQTIYQDPNSNSLTRQQPVQGRTRQYNTQMQQQQQHRGPFITQVTIGDHSTQQQQQQQQNGTKV